MKGSSWLADALLVAASGRTTPPPTVASTAPQWTHGAVCYEVFVRSFFDSNGDGIGDLNGLIAKLDYINVELRWQYRWMRPVVLGPLDIGAFLPGNGTLRLDAAPVSFTHSALSLGAGVRL